MKKRFVNVSNHPMRDWDENQLNQAREFGELYEISFPNIDPTLDRHEVQNLAQRCVEKILELDPTTVMVQGEFGGTYFIVQALKEKSIRVVYACSKRIVKEKSLPDGTKIKESRFQFIRFREY